MFETRCRIYILPLNFELLVLNMLVFNLLLHCGQFCGWLGKCVLFLRGYAPHETCHLPWGTCLMLWVLTQALPVVSGQPDKLFLLYFIIDDVLLPALYLTFPVSISCIHGLLWCELIFRTVLATAWSRKKHLSQFLTVSLEAAGSLLWRSVRWSP